MMLLMMLLNLAFAGEEPVAVDLDGDGKVERIVYPTLTDSNYDDELEIKVGKAKVDYFHEFPTEVAPLDLKSGDGRIELRACSSGPRDTMDCVVYRYTKGKLEPVLGEEGKPVTAAAITATGSGIVLLHTQHRIYTQVDKTVLQGDGTLKKVRQPFYAVNAKVKVDRTFPVTLSPGGGATVANVRPDSEITLLVTDGENNMLVWLSSGITGWVSYETLMKSSNYILSIEMAG
jgi:hypothetical protein